MTASAEDRDPLRGLVGLFWVLAATGVATFALAVAMNMHSLPESVRHLAKVAFLGLLLVLSALSIAFLAMSVRRRAALSRALRGWLLVMGTGCIAGGGGVILHNLFDALSEWVGEATLIGQALNGLAVATFFAAIFSPVVFLVGFAGSGLTLARHRQRAASPPSDEGPSDG